METQCSQIFVFIHVTASNDTAGSLNKFLRQLKGEGNGNLEKYRKILSICGEKKDYLFIKVR